MTGLERETGYVQRGVVAPDPTEETDWWWKALADNRFLLPKCVARGHYFFPPDEMCLRCGSRDVVYSEAPATGHIYSWIVVHRALDSAFTDDVPYTVVAVDMDAGVRLFGRLLRGEPRDGAAVTARTYEAGGHILLGFAAAAEEDS